MSITSLALKAEKVLSDNAPMILTGLATAGVLGTAVLAVKATLQAETVLAHNYPDPIEREEAPRMEKIKMIWTLYIPAAGSLVLTITSIILANQIGMKRAAAMAAAYSLSEKSFETYREKVKEKYGQNKEREVRDDISADAVRNNPPNSAEVIITGEGNILCYDQYSSRYFEGTKQKIDNAVNKINHQVLHHGYASLNDLYSELEIPITKFGEELGWTSMEMLEVSYSSVLTELDKPALVMNFHTEPIRDYWRVN